MSIQTLRHSVLLTLALVAFVAYSPQAQAAPASVSATAPHSGPHREIFGFALASSLSDPTVGYPTWNFSLLSTVAFFGLHVRTDGYFQPDSDATVWASSQLGSLVSTAHASGTKVVVTIVLQDFSAGTPSMCAGLTHYSTTVAQTVSEVKAKGVDGVNVDYEGLDGACGTSDPLWARHTFTTFISAMRSALPSGSYLTVDTYASSAADTVGFFDVSGLATYTDALFVMAYDLEYSNYSRSPLGCTRFCLGPTAPLGGYYYNDTTTLQQYTSVISPSKVILGVPYYGRKACVASATPNQYPTSGVVADSYLDASQEATSSEVQAGSYATHLDANDPAGQERWDTWYNTTLGCTRELYWDDANALGHKYDLVNSSGVRGVGIWNLNYGGGAPELWNELNVKFGTATPWFSLGGVLTSSPAVTSSGASRTDVFARGTDNALWHRFWNGSTWSAWESLGGVLTQDPAAVAVGSGRIDVVVRGSTMALWHRSFDGSSWSAWENIGGVATSAPAVASWGAGRLDVVVRGTNNALWHRAWNGTSWGAWDSAGGVANSNPSAVSWGTGRVDVFVRGTDNALWHRSTDGTGVWSPWDSLGGILMAGPGSSSCASSHLDVFVLGTDGGLWQRGYNGTGWSAWSALRGQWTANPGAACSPGTTSVSLAERGPDYALWETTTPGT
jgi:spore germination protein YaaH